MGDLRAFAFENPAGVNGRTEKNGLKVGPNTVLVLNEQSFDHSQGNELGD
jgi:hypothetical protein